MSSKFELRKTAKLSEDAEAEFVSSPWEESFDSAGKAAIPNVGPATQKCLAEAGITNQFQLIGQFLMFRKTGDNTQERCNLMVNFLETAGVGKSLLSVITYTLAKKLNRTFPGFFVDSDCVVGEGSE